MSIGKTTFASLLLAALLAPAARAETPEEVAARLRDEDAAVEATVRGAISRVSPSIVEIETLGSMPEKIEPQKDEQGGGGTQEGVIAKKGFKQAFGPSTGIAVGKDLVIASTFPLRREPRHIFVTRHDGKSFVATVLGKDEGRMLALLKVEGADLVPIPESKRDDAKVGRFAIALGRGLGVASVSVGIVSAVNRLNGRAIQTSAATSPANYGGPLVSIDGDALGIIVPLALGGAMAGEDTYDSGIGFAIPLEDVRALLPRLEAGKPIKPAFLGVRHDPGRTESGVLVEAVEPGSPADKAGLKAKDVIVEADGSSVEASHNLMKVLGRKSAGEKVALVVLRNGKRVAVEAELAEPPARPAGPPHPRPGGGPGPGPKPDPGHDHDHDDD